MMSANRRPIVYDRMEKHKPVYSCTLPKRILSDAVAGMRGKIVSAVKNVRPPAISTGKYTPTYMALQGLADGYPGF